jgi:hypothetical protein
VAAKAFGADDEFFAKLTGAEEENFFHKARVGVWKEET